MAAEHDGTEAGALAGNGADQVAGRVDPGDGAGILHCLFKPLAALEEHRGESAAGVWTARLGDGSQRVDIGGDAIGADGSVWNQDLSSGLTNRPVPGGATVVPSKTRCPRR
ncbi:hypothetical protein D3C87_1729070 [compost metagenome]